MSILSDCLDKAWCSVIVNGAESTICIQKIAQAECPMKCSSYLTNDDPCFTPGTNWNVECCSIKERAFLTVKRAIWFDQMIFTTE